MANLPNECESNDGGESTSNLSPLEEYPIVVNALGKSRRPLLFVVQVRELIKLILFPSKNACEDCSAQIHWIEDRYPGLLPYPNDKAASIILTEVENLALQIHDQHLKEGKTFNTEVPKHKVNLTKIRKAITFLRFHGVFEPVYKSKKYFYVAFNKPRGALCGRPSEVNSKPRGKKAARTNEPVQCLYDKLQPNVPHLPHVGRLDKDTEGLILLTDDGDIHSPLLDKNYASTNDKVQFTKATKVYFVDVSPARRMSFENQGDVNVDEALVSMRKPLEYTSSSGSNKFVKSVCDPAVVSVLSASLHPEVFESFPMNPRAQARFRVEIGEGKFHQVRRLCARAGLEVVNLLRYSFGPISLEGLKSGCARSLTAEEAHLLQTAQGARGEAEVVEVYPLTAV